MELILPDGHDCPRCGSWHVRVGCQHRLLSVGPMHGWNAWRAHAYHRRLLVTVFRCTTCRYRFEGPAHDALEHRLTCIRALAA